MVSKKIGFLYSQNKMQSFGIIIYRTKSQKKKSILEKVVFFLNVIFFKNCLHVIALLYYCACNLSLDNDSGLLSVARRRYGVNQMDVHIIFDFGLLLFFFHPP